jgi:hypothetical protein
MDRRQFLGAFLATLPTLNQALTAECGHLQSGKSTILSVEKGYLIFENKNIYNGLMAFKFDPKSTYAADPEEGSGVLYGMDFGGQIFPNDGYVPGSSGYRYDEHDQPTSLNKCDCGSKPTVDQLAKARTEAKRLLKTPEFKGFNPTSCNAVSMRRMRPGTAFLG